jgi:hypothetical protein
MPTGKVTKNSIRMYVQIPDSLHPGGGFEPTIFSFNAHLAVDMFSYDRYIEIT